MMEKVLKKEGGKSFVDLSLLSSYDYELPPERIAQNPANPRDSSKLFVVHKDTREFEHRIFREIIEYFSSDDLLVINDTRVLPARLHARRATGASIEILLLSQRNEEEWEALVRPGKRLKEEEVVFLANGTPIRVGSRLEEGLRCLSFPKGTNVRKLLDTIGDIPLPPYIKNSTASAEDYQTVYAKYDGSAAAPTAGLHFTEDLLCSIRKKGVPIAAVTLHVGLGTFRPVKVENVEKHSMHEEFCQISEEVALQINETKKRGGRIIAVGTTVVRTLESFASGNAVRAGVQRTRLFIRPGYHYQVVDALITNFHLPKSTLLMLVAAFMGYDLMMEAYKVAIAENYRFFSFGDAMFIV